MEGTKKGDKGNTKRSMGQIKTQLSKAMKAEKGKRNKTRKKMENQETRRSNKGNKIVDEGSTKRKTRKPTGRKTDSKIKLHDAYSCLLKCCN
jgi:hypothetical protein